MSPASAARHAAYAARDEEIYTQRSISVTQVQRAKRLHVAYHELPGPHAPPTQDCTQSH